MTASSHDLHGTTPGSEQDYADIQGGGGPSGALPLVYGHVDPNVFPIGQLQEASRLAISERAQQTLNYGPSLGNATLRTFLRTRFARCEGLALEPSELLLTAGVSSALDMVVRVFTQPGDTVLVEAPSYHDALTIIRDYPVRLASVPLDDQGLLTDALAERLEHLVRTGERPVMLYTIPSFQNPSGFTMSAVRRDQVIDLAAQYRLLIVEDDVYRDLYFEGPPPESLFALDDDRTTIRLGSFSKVLAPGLRLGWAMGSAERIERLVNSGLIQSGGGANPFSAATVAAFCEQGWLDPHIEQLQRVYRQRRDVVLGALEDHMPRGVRWNRPGGGFFIWLELPESVSSRAVLQTAERHGITFIAGPSFYAENPTDGERYIRLPFSFVPPHELVRAVGVLAETIGDLP